MKNIFNYSLAPKFIDEYNPPEDLDELLSKTIDIIRGQDPRYPKGFISDNVYVHTLRCIWIAREFFGDISDLDHPKIDRTLLIHDLPEIVVGDAPSPAVKDGIVEKPDDI